MKNLTKQIEEIDQHIARMREQIDSLEILKNFYKSDSATIADKHNAAWQLETQACFLREQRILKDRSKYHLLRCGNGRQYKIIKLSSDVGINHCTFEIVDDEKLCINKAIERVNTYNSVYKTQE